MAVRATQLVSLTDLAGEGQVIMPDFWGVIDDERVFVTAVLERTVVYIHGTERKLTRLANCYVDPTEVEVRTSSNPLSWRGRSRGSVKVVAAEDGGAETDDDIEEPVDLVDDEDEVDLDEDEEPEENL